MLIDRGLNFEFGLTGSKLQAVACAAASAAFKVSQRWHLRPEKFNPERFTQHVSKAYYFQISLQTEALPSIIRNRDYWKNRPHHSAGFHAQIAPHIAATTTASIVSRSPEIQEAHAIRCCGTAPSPAVLCRQV